MSAGVHAFRPLGGPVSGVSNRLAMRNTYTIPQLGLGTRGIAAAAVADAVACALSSGFRHIDCARAYGNEAAVGAALAQALRTRRVQRADLFIASKLCVTDQHPDHVEAACRASLSDLRLDYLDLYLVHWPVCVRRAPAPTGGGGGAAAAGAIDTTVTLLDTWRAMSRLVDRGLVRSIGVCNCGVEEVRQLAAAAAASGSALQAPVVNQVEQHPGHVDGDLLACHAAHDVLTVAHSPLGIAPSPSASLLDDAVVASLSDFTGFSPARVLLNWSLDRSNVVLVGSATAAHIRSNAKAARFALDDRTRLVLDSYRHLVRHFRVVNPTELSLDGTTPFFAEADARLQRDIDAGAARVKAGTDAAPVA
ncbi:aldo-keto reductase-like protein [Novymonas esmeraldas]|uniref:Aldo-keto reductase-like protein n=1 Tax=Novymonas esmeraldas TaxID=1808958 RepID=A0AAW0EWC4_9TRYP